MDLLLEKYKLIEWLISIEDESIVSRLKNFQNEVSQFKQEGKYSVTEVEKLFISAGLKDIEQGNTISHEDVLREIKEKYNLQDNGNHLD